MAPASLHAIQASEVKVNSLARNKAIVADFYDLMFNKGRPREAAEKYIGDRYIQHNPRVADGAEAFIVHFEKLATKLPGKRVKIYRIIAEGDLVVTHWFQHWPGDQDYAGMDIFRLTPDGKIVEHWDVIQPMPAKSANKNGMF